MMCVQERTDNQPNDYTSFPLHVSFPVSQFCSPLKLRSKFGKQSFCLNAWICSRQTTWIDNLLTVNRELKFIEDITTRSLPTDGSKKVIECHTTFLLRQRRREEMQFDITLS